MWGLLCQGRALQRCALHDAQQPHMLFCTIQHWLVLLVAAGGVISKPMLPAE
jgi:hypothetical protein